MSSLIVTLTAAVAAVAAASAPPAGPRLPPAPPPVRADAATLQAAAALVAQLGIKAQLQAQMVNSVGQMKSGVVMRAMLAQQPGFVGAYQANRQRFDAVLQKAGAIQAQVAQGVIDQNLNGVVAAATQAYARQFTAAELNGLTAFYRSPIGQALQKRQPLVANEIAGASARLIGAKIDAAMAANAARMQAALAPLNSAPPPVK